MSNVPLNGLVSWWKLDESSGTRYDSHGTNHLSPQNGPGYNAVDYKWGASMDCERNSSQHAEISQASQTGLSFGNEDFTYGAWWRAEDLAGGVSRYIFGKWNDNGVNDREFLLFSGASDAKFRAYISSDGSSSTNIGWGTGASTGTWYFVVCWHDATANTINIQVNNGTPLSNSHTTGANQNDSAPFYIGQGDRNNYGWDGEIDEAFVYSRVLTSGERTLLYNSGNGVTYGAGQKARFHRRSRTPGLVTVYEDQG